MRKLLRDSRVYVVWLAMLGVALCATYQVDPYIFGFAVFALGAVTGLVVVAGVGFVVLARGASRRDRWVVLISLILATCALVAALSVLGSFNWA